MKRILVVEDDCILGEGLQLALSDNNIAISLCPDLTQARRLLSHSSFDLAILDINLPDGSGLELLKEIKASSTLPVIMLTANDTEMDVVIGLENGAEDYITKPFSLAILRARVHVQLRRSEMQNSHIIQIDHFSFDFDTMRFMHGKTSVELSKTEQKLLRLLVEHRGLTLKREVLLTRIWEDTGEYVDENTLSVAIKRLRDKLDAADYIKTVYGIGYTWEVK